MQAVDHERWDEMSERGDWMIHRGNDLDVDAAPRRLQEDGF